MAIVGHVVILSASLPSFCLNIEVPIGFDTYKANWGGLKMNMVVAIFPNRKSVSLQIGCHVVLAFLFSQ